MYEIITIIFIIIFLLLVTPVYAGSNFLYSRLIQTDNLIGYKSVVLDKAVYAHSNHLNDLRVINDRDEDVPYILASIRDASTQTQKESFILSAETQYSSIQDGPDSIITIQLNNLNAFSLELNTDERIERTYGLYGVKDKSTHYLSEGELFNLLLSSDSALKKDIEWTNNPPIDRLRLIIHNRDAEPINLKSVTVNYYLDKLVFEDLGNSKYRLAYGNDTLRSPIYNLTYEAINKSERVTQATLGAEAEISSKTDSPTAPMKYKILSNSTLLGMVLLVLLGIGLRLRKRKNNR